MGQSDEYAAVKVLCLAAKRWWANQRPMQWDEDRHLLSPAVGLTTEAERRLATAVAELIIEEA